VTAILIASAYLAGVLSAAAIGFGVMGDRLNLLRSGSRDAMRKLIRMLDRHDPMAGEMARDIAGGVHPSLLKLPSDSPFRRRCEDLQPFSVDAL
jgi:hypothetical protein